MKWTTLFFLFLSASSICTAAQSPDPQLIVEEPSGERVYEYGPLERVRYGSAVSVTLVTQLPSPSGDGSLSVIRMLLACDGSWSALPLGAYFDAPAAQRLNGLLSGSIASMGGIQDPVVENDVKPGLAGLFTESAAVRQAISRRIGDWCSDAFGKPNDYFVALLRQDFGEFVELGTLAKREGATEVWVHTIPVKKYRPTDFGGVRPDGPDGTPNEFTVVDTRREFSRALMAFRCGARTFAMRAKVKYDSQGKISSTDSYRPHEVRFGSMMPQSRAAYLLKIVCRLQPSDL